MTRMFHGTQFSRSLSLCTALSVRGNVSHSRKKKAKFCNLSVIILDWKGTDKKFWTGIQQALPEFSLIFSPIRKQLWFFRIATKCEIRHNFKRIMACFYVGILSCFLFKKHKITSSFLRVLFLYQPPCQRLINLYIYLFIFLYSARLVVDIYYLNNKKWQAVPSLAIWAQSSVFLRRPFHVVDRVPRTMISFKVLRVVVSNIPQLFFIHI